MPAPSFAGISALEVPPEITGVRTAGWAVGSPIGGADYDEVEPPATGEGPTVRRSLNGRWWRLAPDQTLLTPMFGAQCDAELRDNGSWSGTDDYQAWLAITDFWRANPGVRVHHPGPSKISSFIRLPSHFNLTGDGDISKVVNVDASGVLRRAAPFWLGNWHRGVIGARSHGSGDPWRRLIDMYACTQACAANHRSVKVSPADATHFAVGEIAYLRSTVSTDQEVSGTDYELPIRNALHRVSGIDLVTGEISFEHPVGFDEAAPLLCRITPGAEDELAPIEFVQGGRMDGICLYGDTACGSHSTGAYECHLTNISGHVRSACTVNGFTRSSFQFRGEFDAVAAEVKLCADYATIDIQAKCRTAATVLQTLGVGMVSIGEYCRDVRVKVDIVAPSWRGPGLIELQPGKGCKVWARIKAASCGAGHAALPVLLYADVGAPLEDFELVADLEHACGGASNCTVVANGDLTYPPRNGRIQVKARYVGKGAPPTNCIVVHGGHGLVFEGGDYDYGAPLFDAAGNQFRDNITGFEADRTTPVRFIDGKGKGATIAQRNRFRRLDGTTSAW